MATTYMANMVNPEVMGDMIDAKIEALLKITPYAKVDTTLQGVPGDTKTVPSWNYIGDAEDVAEGAEVSLTEMTSNTTTFTIKKAMKAVGITQEAVNSGYGDPIGQAETQLAKSIAGKVDQDVFNAALKATLVYDGTAAAISYSAIVDAIDKFGEEDITDKVMFVHPSQVSKLRKDNDFISADKYNNNVMVSGEIGMICQTRIVPSNRVPKITATLVESSTDKAVKITSSNIDTYRGHVWDATNKKLADLVENTSYVLAETAAWYACPILKLEASDARTEFTETELPAITIFLKKDTQTDADWKPLSQTHEVITAKYYGVALTNGAKVVLAKLKA